MSMGRACTLGTLILSLNIVHVICLKEILSICKTGETRKDYTLHEGIAGNHVAWGSYNDKISSTG